MGAFLAEIVVVEKLEACVLHRLFLDISQIRIFLESGVPPVFWRQVVIFFDRYGTAKGVYDAGPGNLVAKLFYLPGQWSRFGRG